MAYVDMRILHLKRLFLKEAVNLPFRVHVGCRPLRHWLTWAVTFFTGAPYM